MCGCKKKPTQKGGQRRGMTLCKKKGGAHNMGSRVTEGGRCGSCGVVVCLEEGGERQTLNASRSSQEKNKGMSGPWFQGGKIGRNNLSYLWQDDQRVFQFKLPGTAPFCSKQRTEDFQFLKGGEQENEEFSQQRAMLRIIERPTGGKTCV